MMRLAKFYLFNLIVWLTISWSIVFILCKPEFRTLQDPDFHMMFWLFYYVSLFGAFVTLPVMIEVWGEVDNDIKTDKNTE